MSPSVEAFEVPEWVNEEVEYMGVGGLSTSTATPPPSALQTSVLGWKRTSLI